MGLWGLCEGQMAWKSSWVVSPCNRDFAHVFICYVVRESTAVSAITPESIAHRSRRSPDTAAFAANRTLFPLPSS